MKPRLRIGLVLDSKIVPLWLYKELEYIATSDHSNIVVQFIIKGGDREKRIGRTIDWRHVLYDSYQRLDGEINKMDPDADMEVDISPITASIDVIEVDGGNEPDFLTFHQRDVELIRSYDLDILINDSERPLRGPLLQISRYGTLVHSFGGQAGRASKSFGFWEAFTNLPTTMSGINRLSNGEDKYVEVYQSSAATITRSLKRSRNEILLKSASFIPRLLRNIYENGDLKRENIDAFRPITKDIITSSEPSNPQFLELCIRRAPRDAMDILKLLFVRERWAIRYHFSDGPSTDFRLFEKLIPPIGTWWADPHIAEVDGKYYIFIEELSGRLGKGHISVIEVDKKGRHTRPTTVLERPYHLSYPFVFNDGERHYMVPESAENKTIDLYESVNFPYDWKYKKTLMSNVRAYDTTLYKKDGIWWMFCNIMENYGASSNDELFLFFSKDLLSGPWEAHPSNPIITDAATARPGGSIFDIEGVLYRPSQDSSVCAGYAINLNRVEELEKDRYRESKVQYLIPNWDWRVKRQHTYCYCKGLTVIDSYSSDLPTLKMNTLIDQATFKGQRELRSMGG